MSTKTKSASMQRRIQGDCSRKRIDEAYSEVIAELGDSAPYVSKSRIYELIADKVGLSASHVKWILLNK